MSSQPIYLPYLQNALAHAALGIPIHFIPGGQKAMKGEACLNWEVNATTDIAEIIKRAEAHPDMTNYGCVAKAIPGGHLFLDDDGGIRAEFEAVGHKMQKTRKGRSCSGNYHYTYKHSVASLAFWERVGKKAYVAESNPNGELWSLRMHNSYVVGAGSRAENHNGEMADYVITHDVEIIEIPNDLLEFLIGRYEKAQNAEKKLAAADGSIISGARNTTLTSIAGKMRDFGYNVEKIFAELKEINSQRCTPPLDESEIKNISESVGRYKDGITRRNEQTVYVNGAPAGNVAVSQPVTPEIDRTALAPRPVFPIWAIENTTLYEGFVRPVVESSSKNPEFLWLPAAQLAMNYLSDKVRIECQSINWNLFIGLVSDPGKYFKSSSCKLAQRYFELMGMAQTYTPAVRNAEGKVIVMQAGSSEGFGLAMSKINAKNAVMFNDELGKLVAKAGIENSSMPSDILSWYERDAFANATSNEKHRYSFPGDTYTFGMCWCTTTRGFNRHWPRLAGVVSGMEDRMFFCVGPEEPRPLVPMLDLLLQDAAIQTRRMIEAAVQRGVYQYEDHEAARQIMARWDDPRSQGLVEKFALLLTIDLGREAIDSECLERAGAIVDFRNAATKYLSPIEADNAQARVQCEIERELRKNGGKMTYRKLCQDLGVSRYGADFWERAYKSMVRAGDRITEFYELGRRGQKRHMVGIPKIEDED